MYEDEEKEEERKEDVTRIVPADCLVCHAVTTVRKRLRSDVAVHEGFGFA